MVHGYGTADTVNENRIVMDLIVTMDSSLQLKDGWLAVRFISRPHTDVLE